MELTRDNADKLVELICVDVERYDNIERLQYLVDVAISANTAMQCRNANSAVVTMNTLVNSLESLCQSIL